MIPDRVKFTDLDLDPVDMIFPRKVTGNVPRDWTRYHFTAFDVNLYDLDRYIETLIEGRWHSYTWDAMMTTHIVIHFERATDAMMFKLKGGENACKVTFL